MIPLWWNAHQISHIRAYESGKAHQHPIGYAALMGSSDATLYNSDADWVAPEAKDFAEQVLRKRESGLQGQRQ